MTFRDDDIQDALENVWFNEDFFGEKVTFSPRVGSDRVFVAQVEQVTNPEFVGGERWVSGAKIRCRKDAVLGIDEIKYGDKIMLSVTTDPQQRYFTFEGQIEESHPQTWELTFFRQAHKVHGSRSS